MAFVFSSRIDPRKPLDWTDPPPSCWSETFTQLDYVKAAKGKPSQKFRLCRQWEERELARLDKIKK